MVYLLFLQSCSADIEADGGGLGADADNDAEAGLNVDADSAADSDADADTPQARFPDTRPVCRLLPMFVLLTQHLLVFLPPVCTWALSVQKLPPGVVAARSAQLCSVKPSLSRILLLGPAL